MMLVALQRVTCFPARPEGRRIVAAGLLAGAAAAWTSPARAEAMHTSAQKEVRPAPEHQPPLPPPPAAEDGLDALRCRIREYGLRPLEDKLVSLMREFRADEKNYLQWFAKAENTGDDKGMRTWHSLWKGKAEQIELLQSNPRNFVRCYGFLYDLVEPKSQEVKKWGIFSLFS